MASNRTRVKSAALAVEAAQDEAGAAVMVARMGAITRDMTVSQAAMEEQIAAIKLSAVQAGAAAAAELKRLHAGVQAWAEANRLELTRNGRTKTVKLGTGELSWRNLPPRVTIKSEETVIPLLESMGLNSFLRIKTEIDREAIRANPDVARTVPGISIRSAGEDFIVSFANEEVVA